MSKKKSITHDQKIAKDHDFCKGAKAVTTSYPEIVERAKQLRDQVIRDIIWYSNKINPVWQPHVVCSECGTAHLSPLMKNIWSHLGTEMKPGQKEKMLLETVIQLLEEKV